MKNNLIFITLVCLLTNFAFGQEKMNQKFIDSLITNSSFAEVKKLPRFIVRHLNKKNDFDYTYKISKFKPTDNFDGTKKERYVYCIARSNEYYIAAYLHGGISLENKMLLINYKRKSVLQIFKISIPNAHEIDWNGLQKIILDNKYSFEKNKWY